MTETPIDLPVGLRWIKLVCRLGRLVTDSAADENAYPDLVPIGGTLTLAASPSRVRIQEADGRWRSVEVTGRIYTIRADGELVDNEDRVGVYIPDPTSPLIEPQNYTITAAVKPTSGAGWNVTISGSDILPDVVDLVAVSSVGTVTPSVRASFDARLYALEQGGGGGGAGSGIELVSGTVTINSSGAPVREFYCTSAATIGGVSFPAGTAVVFRRTIGGQWGYIVVDGWTAAGSIPDPELITVTATAPNWTDDTTNGGGYWSTPTITGVTYSPASGTATPGQTLTVTATSQTGYQLTGTTTWTHTFPVGNGPAPVEVTAAAPTWTDDTVNGGGSWTTPTITGVTYSPASGTAAPEQTVTVTATAQAGYQLSGASSWSHTFPVATGPVDPLTVTHTANGAAQAGSDTLTWEEMDIGAASVTRRVAVAFTAYSGSGLTGVDGSLAMTIGGVTATRDVQGWGAANSGRMTAIFSAVVPTGTTADVTVTYTGSIPNANISVWAIDGAPSAFHGADNWRYNNNTNNGVSLTVPTANGSASIFAAYSVATDRSFTWSDADAAPTASTSSPAMTITSASRLGTSAGTHTASVTCNGINIFGAGGTWVPA